MIPQNLSCSHNSQLINVCFRKEEESLTTVHDEAWPIFLISLIGKQLSTQKYKWPQLPIITHCYIISIGTIIFVQTQLSLFSFTNSFLGLLWAKPKTRSNKVNSLWLAIQSAFGDVYARITIACTNAEYYMYILTKHISLICKKLLENIIKLNSLNTYSMSQ